MQEYQLTHAARAIGEFIIEDLSNWYVRRSRDRFWGSADRADTRAAFATLHQALVTVSRLMAPLAPFLPDWLHRALLGDGDSVHVAEYPTVDEDALDTALERGMEAVRTLSTLGRAAREEVGIRVRQPLGTVYAVIPSGIETTDDLLAILRDELNVKAVEFMHGAEELVTFTARPNFKALGARLGKLTPRVADAIRALPSDRIAAFRRGEGASVEVDGQEVPLAEGDFEVIQNAQGDFVIETEAGFTLALDPALTPELRAEGLAREIVSRVQKLRKDTGLEVSDRIRLGVFGDDVDLGDAMRLFGEMVRAETLAVELETGSATDYAGYETDREVDLDGITAVLALARTETN
jgi:isoleucyl-tRNA synthetase